jgi:hypothetical protein
MLRTIRVLSLGVLLLSAPAVHASPGGGDEATVSVECSRGSGLILISIANHRRIGNVKLEVRDAQGRSLYYEEGKAMTEELVRRLDKGVFPKGEAVLTVTARDFAITQHFNIQ